MAFSFESPEIDQYGVGLINRLPNEMMQFLLEKTELDGDVTQMAQIRYVSTRWRANVEYICGKKKSLVVLADAEKYNILSLPKYFFGLSNLKKFSRLPVLSTLMPPEYKQSQLELFANIVQLSVRCDDNTRVGRFVEYINSLVSLKQLDLDGNFATVLYDLSLANLEHLSFDFDCLEDIDHRQLVANLGQKCVRVFFGGNLHYQTILQWHNINPNWLANLTHLRMIVVCEVSEDCAQVVHYLSEHATSLVHLNIVSWNCPFILTPAMIDDLSRLTNLAELEYQDIEMDVDELGQAASQRRLTSLTSVLKCHLNVASGNAISVDQFARVLSAIFPNLVHLEMAISQEFATDPLFCDREQYSQRFPDNQNIKITFY